MRERRDKPDLFWCQAGEKASEHSSVYGQVKDKKHVQGRVCPRRDKRRSRLKTAGRASGALMRMTRRRHSCRRQFIISTQCGLVPVNVTVRWDASLRCGGAV